MGASLHAYSNNKLDLIGITLMTMMNKINSDLISVLA